MSRRMILMLWAAKPTSCPYCHSLKVSAELGRWACDDCDREGSY